MTPAAHTSVHNFICKSSLNKEKKPRISKLQIETIKWTPSRAWRNQLCCSKCYNHGHCSLNSSDNTSHRGITFYRTLFWCLFTFLFQQRERERERALEYIRPSTPLYPDIWFLFFSPLYHGIWGAQGHISNSPDQLTCQKSPSIEKNPSRPINPVVLSMMPWFSHAKPVSLGLNYDQLLQFSFDIMSW